MSGNADPLAIFLKAHAAKNNRLLKLKNLEFGTLSQHLITATDDDENVALLLPWDFCSQLDWRVDTSSNSFAFEQLADEAREVAKRWSKLPQSKKFYISAPISPRLQTDTLCRQLSSTLETIACELGCIILEGFHFRLTSYLASGCPVSGSSLGEVASKIIQRRLASRNFEPKKVLISDLDNTLWSGIVGEVGANGVHYRSEGAGFKHYIYQSFLRQLRKEGVLLVVVSRNNEEDAIAPIKKEDFLLNEDDFVSILASYNAKSSQIKLLADNLNLGLDSFVFVDDNLVEIAEVTTRLPSVQCLQFPTDDQELVRLLQELRKLFSREGELTSEDRNRTALYRTRVSSIVPSDLEGADLNGFLKSLEMSLIIKDRSTGDRERAEQLINKTNQFNVNGERLQSNEIQKILNDGGRLITASLVDRIGDHGEIFCCLISNDGEIRSLVMSCRVFQRQVEDAVFCWMAKENLKVTKIRFKKTARNEQPIQKFLHKFAGDFDDECYVPIDMDRFYSQNKSSLELFHIQTT